MLKVTDLLDTALMVIAAVMLVMMLGHVSLEVILRLSGVSVQLQTITYVSAWYMVALVFCALPWAEGHEGHISVDAFTSMLPAGVRVAMLRAFDGITTLCLGFLTWLSALQAWDKTMDGEIWETSTGYFLVWPGRWAIVLSFAVLTLRYALRCLTNRAVLTPAPAGEGD
ncbi:MAG: TRAP transporter small permease [Vannielia sp.]|uniref:TRAP transporter small permease n=1 Tax=Vannielia sp. TaxID=2813045 RepID=UPI003B8E75B2